MPARSLLTLQQWQVIKLEEKSDHKLIQAHEKLLQDHERRLGRVEHEMLQMHKEFLQGLDRVDQSNKYLREQNNDILGAIIKRNEMEEQHKHQLQLISRKNMWQLIIGISSTTGLLYIILQQLFKIL